MISAYKNVLMSLVILLVTSVSYAQKNRIEKANKEFDKYSYIDAREIYLKVVEDGYASAQVYQKLGDTYYYNGEYGEAATWYQKAIDQFADVVEPVYYYRAAQSLKSLKQYEASDKLMETYDKLGGGNLIVKNFNEDPEYLKSIAFKAKNYTIEKLRSIQISPILVLLFI